MSKTINYIDNALTATLGVIYCIVLIAATITVVPAIIIVIMSKADCVTWHDALKDVYVNAPIDLLTNNL